VRFALEESTAAIHQTCSFICSIEPLQSDDRSPPGADSTEGNYSMYMCIEREKERGGVLPRLLQKIDRCIEWYAAL